MERRADGIVHPSAIEDVGSYREACIGIHTHIGLLIGRLLIVSRITSTFDEALYLLHFTASQLVLSPVRCRCEGIGMDSKGHSGEGRAASLEGVSGKIKRDMRPPPV